MKSRKHGIVLIVISLFFIFSGEVIPGIFLVSFGSFLLYKWINDPIRALENKIQIDAKKFMVRIPTSYPLYMEFISFYSQYIKRVNQFPALKETYKELVESMWIRLSTESDIKSWKEIIRKTNEKWPVPIKL